MTDTRYDLIVVGQGIAGTCIAFQFIDAGYKVLVIDPAEKNSASLVASGIINPVTGRHFVKTWNFDLLWEYLISFYPKIEKFIGCEVFKKLTVFRGLPTVKDYNDWMMREGEPDIEKLIEKNNSIDQFAEFYSVPELYTSIRGGRVDTENLVLGFRKFLINEGDFLEEEFNFDDFTIGSNIITYKNVMAEKIIFCEGYKARSNPYFSHLPFNPFKGDILIYNSDKKLTRDILKNELFFVPISDNKVWIGTKNSYQLDSEEPNPILVDDIRKKADTLLKSGFTFDKARAGIRPSVKDRKPLLGVHSSFSNMFIFNGLGSKGTSLAPFYSQCLFDFIVKGEVLPSEVNISRFEN